jgi:predicted Zn-dependent protease
VTAIFPDTPDKPIDCTMHALPTAVSRIMRLLTSDDQLAWVLGHELAHIILQSQGSSEKSKFLADYVGSYLTARAGYNTEDIIYFWQRFAAEDPPAIALEGFKIHPSIAKRIVKIRASTQEIKDKQVKNIELTPNLETESRAFAEIL